MSPASIGVVGFALWVYPVAVERGWMARADAVERSLAMLPFFHDSDQSESPEATGFTANHHRAETPTRAEGVFSSIRSVALLTTASCKFTSVATWVKRYSTNRTRFE